MTQYFQFQGGTGTGFALGPVNNLFGTTAGDALAQPTTVSPAASKSAAETVRDTYFTANPTNLAEYDADPNLNIRIFYTSSGENIIVHQIRQGNAWVDNGSVSGIQGLSGNVASLAAVTTGNIPQKGSSGEFEDSSLQETTDLVEVGKRLRTQRGSVEIGQANRVSGFGALLKIESLVTGNTFVLPFQQYDLTTGSNRTVELDFDAPTMTIRQSVDTQNQPSTGQFTVSGTGLPDRIIWEFVLKCPPNGTLGNLRFQMTVSGQSSPFFSYPSEARYEADDGEDVSAGADGRHIIDLQDAPIFLGAGQDVLVDYAVDSGTILGDGTTPYYEENVSNATEIDMARLSEVPTNVTDLSDVTDAGSGSIITDAERTKLSGIATGATDGVIVQEEGTQVAATGTTLNFTGAGATATAVGDVVTINIPGGGTSTTATLTSFSIDIPATVAIGTDLNVAKTVRFTTNNVSQISTITLVVTDGDNKTLTVPGVDGAQSQSVTLSGIDTSAAGTITFQLNGETTGGQTVLSNMQSVTVRATQADEFAYYGVRATNDFPTVDLAELTSVDVQPPGTQFTISGTWPATQILGILEPADRQISSIIETAFGSETYPDRWTVSNNARTINGQLYNLLTITNNGPSGTFEFRVTHT